MEYQLKKINIDVDNGETPQFPPLVDRVIEMRGQVVELTLSGLIKTQEKREKFITELSSKLQLEKAKVENIESFHPFIKDMSEQDIYTAWLYFQSKSIIKGCEEEIAKTQGYIDYDKKEIEEIKRQIPELSEVFLEVEKMLNQKHDQKDETGIQGDEQEGQNPIES